MPVEDLLSEAASATQQMTPNAGQTGQSFTSMQTTLPPMPTPMPRFQTLTPVYPQTGGFPSVGARKRADRQAILQSVAGIVKSGTDYLAAKKQRALTNDITRLMEASSGRQEAQQILQSDPNNAEAKKALAQNTAIINDIMSDPKKVKQLQKAYNIDLFGGGKNKSENQALIKALQDFQAKQKTGDTSALNPTAARFMQSQPMRQQLNPEAAAQANAIKQGLLPNANAVLKANVDNYKTIQSAKTAEERSAAIDKAAQIRADASDRRTQAIIDAANIRLGGQQYAADVRAAAQVKVAGMVAKTWTERIQAMQDIASMKQGNTVIGNMSKEATSYTNELQRLITENTKLQSELDKKGSSIFGYKAGAMSDADAQSARATIMKNNIRMQDLQVKLMGVQKRMETLNKMGILSLPVGDSGDNNGSEGTQDHPIAPPSDDNDDED